MVKKAIIVAAAIVVVGLALYGACRIVGAEEGVGAPQVITKESPCPVVGCASGECHGFDNVPEPDGIHEMECPEANCSSAECHAWETLGNRYHQASDGSLNVWILLPALLVMGMVLVVKKVEDGDEQKG